ncbi:CDP-glycerol glycerophosphotransferase family protein [Glutamicibacter sp. MNS18]|uniref:glycosyltransferase n=1 Tax=Glutamicibacter sp. MNS18 TaxID=2989817 RepID=UPI002235DE2E|nr:glycosyltransferase [Glutamicibacter sp. MNS18]MCW4466167.1 CDP-glycerol glycerophosphotransferase family protein [Glutamicibacter sp. MNS18]
MPNLSSAKTLPRRIKRLARTELRHYWQKAPLQPRTILYESFSGNGMLCQPEAIFRHLLERSDFQDYKHVWVLNDFDRYSEIIVEFADNPNVKFVKYLTNSYYRALSTSKYLINNVSFPTQFAKRPGQIYLNTWHGIPLKKMGYDIPGRAADAKNIVRNFLASDYLLSSSPAMTEEMYMQAFKLCNIFQGKIIEEGNPRVDRQFDAVAATKEFTERLRKSGSAVDDRKIILYAPTWKGESYFSPHNDGASLKALVTKIEKQIDTSKYRVMIKAHQVVSEAIGKIVSLKEYLIPNSMPTNVALGAADILITDYSSIFFDYLSRDRPVIFYIPDLEDYKRYRDLYVGPDELPGPVARSSKELVDILASLQDLNDVTPERRSKYLAMKEKYVPYEDGEASNRIVDIVLRSHHDGMKVKPGHTDGRQRILIYAGGMIPNGITTSALNLLDNIDYAKYDVTVLCPFSSTAEQQHSYAQINPKARLMFRFGTFNGGYVSNSLRLNVLKNGSNNWAAALQNQKALWESEWKRCFGDATFDHMIDFSGYTPFWGTLFLHGPAKSRSIWLHNDLAADAHRSIEGNKPLKDGLYATFSIYKKFDNLVSVSQGLKEINESSLQKWAPNARFCSASNTVNASKIRKMASLKIKSAKMKIDDRGNIDPILRSAIMGKLVAELIDPDLKISDDFTEDLKSHITREPFFTFFSAGRLSPEKNHSRLIKAFSMVHQVNPNTRLVIAGDGPLRQLLESEIIELGLTESVKLVGHTKNPYRLMNFADVFVLSSDYEGQPMVLLEALVLGIPVITTSFGSVSGALPSDVGKIVPPQVGNLAAAMLDESLRPSSNVYFNVRKYNQRAVKEFEQIIDN